MASKGFSAEEALAYIDSDELDLAEFEDNESLDGDKEVTDYINSQGEEEVVSCSALSSTVFAGEKREPAYTIFCFVVKCVVMTSIKPRQRSLSFYNVLAVVMSSVFKLLSNT